MGVSRKRAFFGTFWRGGIGAIGRCLHLASLLREEGVECGFFAEGPAARFVSEEGFVVVPPPSVLPPDAPRVPNVSNGRVVGVGASFSSLGEFYALRGYADAPYLQRAFRARYEAIRAFGPDILFGYWSWETTIAARVLQRPVINIIQRCLHPSGGGFAHLRTGATGDRAVTDSFNELLTALRLPAVRCVEDLMVGDVTMVSGTPTTDPLPPDPDLFYTGPLLWYGAEGADTFRSLGQHEKKAWIYASDDPSWVGGDFLVHVVARALRDAGFVVVISSGGHRVPELQEPGILCTDYVRGDRAAAWADVILGRGGHDLFWTAVLAGKPFVGAPPNSEWLDYCETAKKLGVGDYCTDAGFDSTVLRRQVERLVRSPDVAGRLQHLRGEALALLNSSRALEAIRSTYPSLLEPV